MRSSFFEFNVATSAMFLSKSAFTVVAHNIANAETPGYSRQYAELRATTPLTFFNGKGMIGTGAEAYGIGQYRNFYLDTKFWAERSSLCEYSVKNTQMGILQRRLNDLSTTGTSSCFDDFFKSLQSLDTSADDRTYRNNAIKAAEALAKYINNQAESLKKQQSDVNEDVKTVVNRINSLGQQIRSLNEQIFKYELDGSNANDLRDARANLVDELSKYVNVEVKEVEMNEDYAAGKYPDPEDRGISQKRFIVMINSYDFVNHITAQTLEVQARTEKVNPMDVPGLYDVYFGGSGAKFNLYDPDLKGELKGLIDVRDGNNSYYFKGTNIQTGTIPVNGVAHDTLVMDANTAMRLDLQPGTGGEITVTDANGKKVELAYANVTYVNGQYTFIMATGTTVPTLISPNTYTSATVGVTTSYKGIPHYLDKLNELVRTFAKAINEGKNRKGEDIPGVTGHIDGYSPGDEDNPDPKKLGLLFFSYDQNVTNNAILDYNSMTCENFQVNSQLLADSSLIAAWTSSTAGVDSHAIIEGFLNLEGYKSLFAEGKISDYINGISSEIGIDVKQADNFQDNYEDVLNTIKNQRLSVSGVDISEETALALRYQQLFHAASKLISIINDIYDTTINRMGV